VEFNLRVRKEAQKLDESVKIEVNSLRDELEREQDERARADKALLEIVTQFLVSL
jgi:hypothetical protein